ncbi:hypothetical protein P7E02_12550 [Enterococcus hulanensis]|uniref:hypothetical protein n=1 Tax=Enterococcus hulanensis TaxID=2559929 RepID=UPI00288EF3A7|nr:hypothetical protein [Enterococcus hulanensis]MDT2660704.1 hypothetical protein [Enterococcus hulanensis]
MSWKEVRNMQLRFVKQIISTFPGWTIDSVLETDNKRLFEIMFFDQETQAKQPNQVVSMEEWFQEIGR